jgi:hypothetical protein
MSHPLKGRRKKHNLANQGVPANKEISSIHRDNQGAPENDIQPVFQCAFFVTISEKVVANYKPEKVIGWFMILNKSIRPKS